MAKRKKKAKKTAAILTVKEWLVKGEFNGNEKNNLEILDAAGNMLDGCNSHDILGPNVLKTTDGKFYQVQVQALIIPLTREEAEEIVQENS